MRLGEVLTQRREAVSADDDFGSWQPITIHLNGDISARARSTAFKGQMFAAYPGDIIFSKIDARHGAIGILPATIAKAVVTPEFPVFTPVPDRADKAYLGLLARMRHFVMSLAARASGTSGRKRITPAAFEALPIPLPPLDEQRALVAAYDSALTKAVADEAAADEEERAAAQYFAAALGLAMPPPLPDRPIFVARFADLDRWGHEAALRRTISAPPAASPWPMVRLGDIIADLENGWSPKCLDRPAGPGEWGVLKLGAVSFGSFDEGENKALPAHLPPRPSLAVQAGQVLVSRANVTRLVGATAYVREISSQLLLCDKIFRLVFQPDGRIDPEFAAEVLRTKPVRDQIEASLTGTSPTMKNISKPALLALTFPLPPLDVQRKLVAALNDAKDRASVLRQSAAAARAAALKSFENALYASDAS